MARQIHAADAASVNVPLSRENVGSDRRLDDDFMLLPRNGLAEPGSPVASFLLHLTAVHNRAEGIDLLAADEDVHPDKVGDLVRRLLVVKGSKAGGDRLQVRVKSGDNG